MPRRPPSGEALETLERERAKKKRAQDKKMADGGFRPGYNLQLAVAGEAQGGPRTKKLKVRGLDKVTNVAVLSALAHNLLATARRWFPS